MYGAGVDSNGAPPDPEAPSAEGGSLISPEKDPYHHPGFDRSILNTLPVLTPPEHSEQAPPKKERSRKEPKRPPKELSRGQKAVIEASQNTELVSYSKTLLKDYVSMARDYVNQETYRDLDSQIIKCVLCKDKVVTTVFFPCQHKCTCLDCIDKNNIGKPGTEGSWNFCAICCDEIKIALEHDGSEVERYWKWVREVKPFIPVGFVKSFTKKSTARIKTKHGVTDMGKVGDDESDDDEEEEGGGKGKGSRACAVM
jgi:hypothetical protein